MSQKLNQTITFRIPKQVKNQLSQPHKSIGITDYLRKAISDIINASKNKDWASIQQYMVIDATYNQSNNVMMSLNVTNNDKKEIEQAVKDKGYLNQRCKSVSQLMRQLCISYVGQSILDTSHDCTLVANPLNIIDTHQSVYLIDIDIKNKTITIPRYQWEYTNVLDFNGMIQYIKSQIIEDNQHLIHGQYPEVAALKYNLDDTHEYQKIIIDLEPIWDRNDTPVTIKVDIPTSLEKQAKAQHINLNDLLTKALHDKLKG